MKKKILFMFVMLVAMIAMLSISASATYYEPDGGSATETLYSDSNRTIYLNAYDESGTLLKSVTYKTKRGEDALISFSLYGYDLVSFSNNQGVWETCKLTNFSSNGGGDSAYVQIRYYFRTAMSKSSMTIDCRFRKASLPKRVVRQLRQTADGGWWAAQTEDKGYVDYRSYFTADAISQPGYYLRSGDYSGFAGYVQYSLCKTYSSQIWLDWDWHDMGSHDEASSYSEGSDGKLDYCDNRVYYVDFHYLPNSYTISYNANGGSGAPSSQTVKHDRYIVLSSTKPTRSGYIFQGWGTSASDTTADYQPGNGITGSGNLTLYAIWLEDVYNFSVSDLSVSPNSVFKNETATIRVRADNWDRDDAYNNISVQFYIDGVLKNTQSVNFAVYGGADLTYTVNVGTSVGTHTAMVRINWNGRTSEDSAADNEVSTIYTVKEVVYDFGIDYAPGNASYKQGMDVMTTYTVTNDGEYDLLPSQNLNANFNVYYYANGVKTSICSKGRSAIVIPAGKSNIIYFKWHVPDGLAGTKVYLDCTLVTSSGTVENNKANNTVSFNTTISKSSSSQTPNTRFETQAPSSYNATSAPATTAGSASWKEYEYVNGAFVLKQYGIRVSVTTPSVDPSTVCKTAVLENGVWTIKSGYGVSMAYAPTITSVSGYYMPSSNNYTGVQEVYVRFPEYDYAVGEGKQSMLQYANGTWCFVANADADGSERIHYIPVWVEDGNYVMAVVATEVWTPAGMITAVRRAEVIKIDGTIYDDYYIGG